MVEVVLFAKTECCWRDFSTEKMLDTIASQSRTHSPLTTEPREKLFYDTIEWGHHSIQEFVDYTFWIKDFSRVGLAQLTRHRIASYNVMSGRHVPYIKATVPKGIHKAHGEMKVQEGPLPEDNIWVEWVVADDGEMQTTIYNDTGDATELPKHIKLEDVRMFYPTAVNINMFFKINGRSLRNFLKLRMDRHAQWEIRELASKIYLLVLEDCETLLCDI